MRVLMSGRKGNDDDDDDDDDGESKVELLHAPPMTSSNPASEPPASHVFGPAAGSIF